MTDMTEIARRQGTREQERASIFAAQVDWVWAACALGAAAALTLAAFLPLWTMTMHAPQYPDGLRLTAYGTDMTGDLSEINGLNHYVGIKAIDPDTVLELDLFPFAMAVIIIGLIVAAFKARARWIRIGVAAVLWSIPVAMLLDLQYWLYRYGHDLDPTAPIRIDEFTPKVLGTTKIIQFETETMVSSGFWLMVLAALLVTGGPWLTRFVAAAWRNTGTTAAISAVAVLLTVAVAGMPTASAQAQETPSSITAAIDAAAPGDTVVIPPGIYHENITITKPLTLTGEGLVTIDGGGNGDVVRIEADDVTLRGFTIRNSAQAVADEPAGIRAIGDQATIEGNHLEEVLYGIVLQESHRHVIRDNRISSISSFPPERRGHAIYLWYSDGSRIEGNTIRLAKDGLFLGFATNTILSNNDVRQVRYGIHYMYAHHNTFSDNTFRDSIAGAAIMYSTGVKLSGNEFAYNKSRASGYGILFKDVDDVEMTNNRIHHNRVGLTVDGAPRTPGAFVTLRGNLIGYNEIALDLFTTVDATFVENTFVGNVRQVESRGGNLEKHNNWSLDGRGNYWDDYRGFDADGNGIGDIEYRYEGAFDELVQRSEALQAYSFTFAHSAIDLSARWFPVYRPAPRAVDPYPLMRPTVTLQESGTLETRGQWVAIGALLIAVPAAFFVVARRSFAGGWSACSA